MYIITSYNIYDFLSMLDETLQIKENFENINIKIQSSNLTNFMII